MKNKSTLTNALICAVAMIFLWTLYVFLIAWLIPDLSIRSKISIAVAFSIPSVVMLGVTTEKCKKKN